MTSSAPASHRQPSLGCQLIKPLAKPFGAGLVLMALAWLTRKYAIEPETIAFACDANPWAGWCAVRMLVIQTFAQMGLGWVALTAGVVALFCGKWLPAMIAWCVGCVGLILYCYEFSAVGALAGALVILRSTHEKSTAHGQGSHRHEQQHKTA